MSKTLYEEKEQFRIVSVTPKKGNPKTLEAWILYGKVGSGSPVTLTTKTHSYKVVTCDYMGGQIWECTIVEVIKL